MLGVYLKLREQAQKEEKKGELIREGSKLLLLTAISCLNIGRFRQFSRTVEGASKLILREKDSR